MNREIWNRKLLKSILFIFVLLLLINVLSGIFLPKWLYMDNPEDWDGQTNQYTTFYKLPSNSIDVILLGASTTMYAVYPIELYASKGIVSYSLASPRQQMAASYYWLKEAAKTQSLQCVVLDITQLIRDTNLTQSQYETTIWKSLGYMKASSNKLHAIQACTSDSSSTFEYIFPLFRFHDRWNDLSAKDFKFSNTEYPSYVKGAQIATIIAPYQGYKSYHAPAQIDITNTYKSLYPEQESADRKIQIQLTTKIDPVAEKYFRLIKKYCADNNITLVCIKIPQISEWTEDMSDVLSKFALDNDFEIYDMSRGEHYVNIDWDVDTVDNGNHLNYFGAKKISSYLSNLLRSLSIQNRKGDPAYSVWDSDLKEYQKYIKAELMKTLPDADIALGYLDSLVQNSENITIILSVKDDISNGWNEQFKKKFDALGLQTDLYNKSQNSYIAVIDCGKVVYEKLSSSPLIYRDILTDFNGSMHKVDITSQGMVSGNACSIAIDNEEYACQTKGLNIVVYDKSEAQVTSSIAIDIFLNGRMLEKSSLTRS